MDVEEDATSIFSLPFRPRHGIRPENILRYIIHKSRRPNCLGVSVQSLTNLISVEYGWPVEIIRMRIERALKQAVAAGRAMCEVEGEDVRYFVAPEKMKECLGKCKTNKKVRGRRLQPET